MLPQLLLSAFLGAQAVAGYAVLIQNTPLAEAVTPVAPGERWTYEDCGTPDDLIELQDITISPDPPKPGQDLEVTVKGRVKERLEEGTYADVLVKIGIIKLLQKRFDVCEEARNANATIQCPVEPGDYTLVQTVALPKEIPPAKFSIAVRAYGPEDEDAACVNLKVDFTPHRGGLHLW
ncbi:hypothetical protein M408DRAFT_244127 [Serendipita vermifera MAFF 305830]|uniref:Phosphatidylglycerol/phosphatidylinositol transfer protein n=1 Tax=Serendipita vermifera MAFF 305830 TaxID=933852 RepID=A0A0C3AVZ0_SERVB|nr:hypothetical protein M408DRAFT_244127 [Serendipita vermifera MAFF 305830]